MSLPPFFSALSAGVLLSLLSLLLAPLASALPSYCPISLPPSSFSSVSSSAVYTAAAAGPLSPPCFTATDPALSLGWSAVRDSGSYTYRLDAACAGGLPAVNGLVAAAHELPSTLPAVAGGAVPVPQLVLFMVSGDNSTYDIETVRRVTSLSCLLPAAVSATPPAVCWPSPAIDNPQWTTDSYVSVAGGSSYQQQRSCAQPSVLIGSPASQCSIAYNAGISVYQQWAPTIGQCVQPQYAQCQSVSANSSSGVLSCPEAGTVVASGSCSCPDGSLLVQSEPGSDMKSWICGCITSGTGQLSDSAVAVALTCCSSTLLQNCEYAASPSYNRSWSASCAAASSTSQLQAVTGGARCDQLNGWQGLLQSQSTSVLYSYDGWSAFCKGVASSDDSDVYLYVPGTYLPQVVPSSPPVRSLQYNGMSCSILQLPYTGGGIAFERMEADGVPYIKEGATPPGEDVSEMPQFIGETLTLWNFPGEPDAFNPDTAVLVSYVSSFPAGTTGAPANISHPWVVIDGVVMEFETTEVLSGSALACVQWLWGAQSATQAASGVFDYYASQEIQLADIVFSLPSTTAYTSSTGAPVLTKGMTLGSYATYQPAATAAMPMVTAYIHVTEMQPLRVSAVCCSLPAPALTIEAVQDSGASTVLVQTTQLNQSALYGPSGWSLSSTQISLAAGSSAAYSCPSGYATLTQPDIECAAAIVDQVLPGSAPYCASASTFQTTLRCFPLPISCPALSSADWTGQSDVALPVGSITSMILYEGWEPSSGGLSATMTCEQSTVNGNITAVWSIQPVPTPVPMQCTQPYQLQALQTLSPLQTSYNYNATVVVKCVSPAISANPFTITCGYNNTAQFTWNTDALSCVPLNTGGCELVTALNTGTVSCPSNYLAVIGGGACSDNANSQGYLESSAPTLTGWEVTCSGAVLSSSAFCCPKVDFFANCSVTLAASSSSLPACVSPSTSIYTSPQAAICCSQELSTSIVTAQSPLSVGQVLMCPVGSLMFDLQVLCGTVSFSDYLSSDVNAIELSMTLVEQSPTLLVTPTCVSALKNYYGDADNYYGWSILTMNAQCFSTLPTCQLSPQLFPLASVEATPSLQAALNQVITLKPAAGWEWNATGIDPTLPLLLQCNADGSFDFQPPGVVALSCPAWPYDIPNGVLEPLQSAVGGVAYLLCDPGYAPDDSGPTTLTCLSSLTYSSSSLANCLPSTTPTPTVLTVGHYALSLAFGFVLPNTAQAGSGVWTVTYELLFPAAANIDSTNPSEAGILQTQDLPSFSAASQLVQGNLDAQVTLSTEYGLELAVMTDAGSHIEGLQVAVSYAVNYQDLSGQAESSGVSSALLYTMPCGCDIADNPSGAPWQTNFTQLMGSVNELLLAWTPNSLCADVYRINSSTTTLTIADVSTYYAESDPYCDLIQPVTTVLGSVSWQMTGRQQDICIYPLPMPICIGCTAIYPNTASQYITCLRYTPQWYIAVSGTVMTAPTALSPQAAPVENVTLTAHVYDLSSGLLMYESPGVPVQAVALSTSSGTFSFSLVSSVLTAQYYNLTITPSKVDVLRLPSSTNSSATTTSRFVHQFSTSSLAVGGGTAVSVASQAVTHAEVVTGVSFYDLSSLSLSGSVVLNSKATGSQLTYTNFDQCGVAGVSIYAYAASLYSAAAVTAGLQPLVQSAPSAADGVFGLSADLNTVVTLVPVLGDHTFSPASITVSVSSTGVTILTKGVKSLQFADITARSFSISLAGGLCNAFVGFVVPVYELQSQCHAGGALQLQLTAFSTTATTFYLPAVPITLFPYSATVASSGVVYESAMQPSYQGDVNSWLLQQMQTADLTTQNYSVALVYYNSSSVIIDPTSLSAPCVDSVLTSYSSLSPSDASYTIMQQGAVQEIRFLFSQVYGYGPLASTCTQTQGDTLYIVDHVAASSSLCYASGCSVTGVYYPAQQQTVAFYTTTAASPDFAISLPNPAHQTQKAQPDFTQSITYTLLSTAQSSSLFVLISGAQLLGQPTVLPWSPASPLFVARRPPGGTSSATISSGTSYTSRWHARQRSNIGSQTTTLTWTGTDQVVSTCEGSAAGDAMGGVVGDAEGTDAGAVDLTMEQDATLDVTLAVTQTCQQETYSVNRYADQYGGLDEALLTAGAQKVTGLLAGTYKYIKGFNAVTKAGQDAQKLIDSKVAEVAAKSENAVKVAMDDSVNSAQKSTVSEFEATITKADQGSVTEQEAAAVVGQAGPSTTKLKTAVQAWTKAKANYWSGLAKKLLNPTPPTLWIREALSAAKFSAKSVLQATQDFGKKSPLVNSSSGDTGVLGWLQGALSDIGLSNIEQISTASQDLGTSMSMTSTFSYDYSTPTRADYVDGDGDMFLLINSFFTVGLSQVLTATATPGLNGSCPVLYEPDVLSWQSGAATQTTLQWISQHDIVNSVLPTLLLTAVALAAQYDLPEFPFTTTAMDAAVQQTASTTTPLVVGSPVYLHFLAVNTSITGWLTLLAQNELAKAGAVPFQYQFDSMAFSSWANITNRPNHTELGFDLDDPYNPLLFTFYGGGSTSSITLHSRGDSGQDSAHGTFATQDTLVNGGYSVNEILGIELTQDAQEWELVHLQDDETNATETMQYNTITYTFSDADPDDSFTVEVLRDLVWGAPVFVTLAGQSHCVTEQNTTARELISIFSVDQPSFVNVGASQAVSTLITMQSGSETGETWPYFLELMAESNPYGLALSINGQPLGARSHTFVLAADVAVQATLSIERPTTASSFEFSDIQLHLYSKPNWCTSLCDIVCAEAYLTLSVSYTQPCSPVAFAGQLGLLQSFTVNAQSGLTLAIVIYNPEAAVAGRTWADVNQTSLTNIAVQYRTAGSSLESDWLPAINAATGQPVSPLYDQSQQPSSDGDYYGFSWDVQALNGAFELRAATTCVLQGADLTSLAATDPSLLSYSTPALPGLIDYTAPALLSYSPVLVLNDYNAASLLSGGSVPLYYPGQALALQFTEAVVCTSAADQLSIAAYATLTAAPNASAIAAAPSFSMVSYCEGNAVAFTFDPTSTVWPQLVQRFVTLTVTGLTDQAGNTLDPAYPVQLIMQVGSWTPGEEIVLSTGQLSAALHSSSSSSGSTRQASSSSSSSSRRAAHSVQSSSSSTTAKVGLSSSARPVSSSSASVSSSHPPVSSSSPAAQPAVSSSSSSTGTKAKRKTASESSSSAA